MVVEHRSRMPLSMDLRVKILLEREEVNPDDLITSAEHRSRSLATEMGRERVVVLFQSRKAVAPSTI